VSRGRKQKHILKPETLLHGVKDRDKAETYIKVSGDYDDVTLPRELFHSAENLYHVVF
jgi:hypothetical protein